MSKRNPIWVLFGILVISALVLGSAVPVGAETLNFKFYTWVIKNETYPASDVEGHFYVLSKRGAFWVFENGEIATIDHVSQGDFIKRQGPFKQVVTVKFEDKSTITIKSEGTFGGTSGEWKSEIVKGTGRFEGIKGTQSAKAKYLPLEKEETGPKGYGEGTLTYTLPKK